MNVYKSFGTVRGTRDNEYILGVIWFRIYNRSLANAMQRSLAIVTSVRLSVCHTLVL